MRDDSRPPPERAARAFVHRALDVADLLVAEVLLPTRDSAETVDLVKETAEVAMLLRMAARVGDGDLRDRVLRTAERLAPLARSSELVRQLAYRPSRAAPLALAHACLSQVGCPDARTDEIVRAAFGADAARAGDRTPYRILDVAWIHHLVLGDEALTDHPILPATCLGAGVDLVAPSIEEAYAFSHTLPYATDFGRLPLPGWVDEEGQSQVADALVAKALAEDDLDLLGELLMTPTLLRRPWSPVQEFGWRCLTAMWERHPILPGPGLPAPAERESDLARRRRVLGTAYHTSLVGGLLMATTLAHGQVPGTPPTRLVDAPNGAHRPAWLRVWAGLDEVDRASVSVVPTLVGLHQAVAAVDLPEAIAILTGPGATSLPGVVVTQVTELLQRVCALTP